MVGSFYLCELSKLAARQKCSITSLQKTSAFVGNIMLNYKNSDVHQIHAIAEKFVCVEYLLDDILDESRNISQQDLTMFLQEISQLTELADFILVASPIPSADQYYQEIEYALKVFQEIANNNEKPRYTNAAIKMLAMQIGESWHLLKHYYPDQAENYQQETIAKWGYRDNDMSRDESLLDVCGELRQLIIENIREPNKYHVQIQKIIDSLTKFILRVSKEHNYAPILFWGRAVSGVSNNASSQAHPNNYWTFVKYRY